MPIVDRVILTLTANPNYLGFWNYTASVWADKFHVRPTLMFYGSKDEFKAFQATKPGYDVFHVERVPAVTVDLGLEWACTWSLFWGTTQFPDEVCMLAGIDQVPLNGQILEHIKKAPKDAYTIGFASAYGCPTQAGIVFPSSHHVATGRNFKAMFHIRDDFAQEAQTVFQARARYALPSNCWGLDEHYSSEILRERSKTGGIHFIETFHSEYQPTRLWRGKDSLNRFNFEAIRAGRHSEWHANRPFAANDPVFLARLKDSIPDYQWT